MNAAKATRIARAIADMKQAELADRAGLNRSYLSMIESGRREPSLQALEAIARATRLPFHVFALLGAERGELKDADVQACAEELTRLLLFHTQPALEGAPHADKESL